MYEKILEILENNRKNCKLHYLNIEKKSAKDIDIFTRNHYMEFVEWLKDNCDTSFNSDGWYWKIAGIKELFTNNTVYQYWKLNVLKG